MQFLEKNLDESPAAINMRNQNAIIIAVRPIRLGRFDRTPLARQVARRELGLVSNFLSSREGLMLADWRDQGALIAKNVIPANLNHYNWWPLRCSLRK